MLKLLGNRRLPNGTAAAIKELREAHEVFLKWRDVIQIADDYRQERGAKHLGLFLDGLPECVSDVPVFLMFRDVSDHTDDWGRVKHNGRFVSPAFVHWVVHGKAVVNLEGKRLSVKRGDVFAIDMNRRHSVESQSLCITACVTVPRCTV